MACCKLLALAKLKCSKMSLCKICSLFFPCRVDAGEMMGGRHPVSQKLRRKARNHRTRLGFLKEEL